MHHATTGDEEEGKRNGEAAFVTREPTHPFYAVPAGGDRGEQPGTLR